MAACFYVRAASSLSTLESINSIDLIIFILNVNFVKCFACMRHILLLDINQLAFYNS